MGAMGDGTMHDGLVINTIAANLSSIVYFPHSVYVVKDGLKVPVGSCIVGQAWP
ncbi:uncharacterized protein P174DRAFT_363313 [Aspergillus novofumigatus IBT 16806]|uniref:Uncharacterized protein n=1 Tax=Aspergillus novofumigatus (strain IBT 16806) TaxID=1392255 RepID=A0A2I1CJT0_ASPN1|nr:uncharacterized protein P174DRAFT_363313 [Aspergillus novofumigatus IBT 16806]PKX97866.1 hypothetical protein P174DRAFT_363313 [Aspergillus novofumigatus IBT 16806]